MVQASLLDHIDIPPDNVLSVPNPGGDPHSAADAYDQLLRDRLRTHIFDVAESLSERSEKIARLEERIAALQSGR